eukprot:TRINITY_DN30931_c0_g1_i1.p1 TRINITY_DN30931_c0_g1~~TRINITY_DN30931_c0_g1_i1.p1  ORF type:complete len:604 (-),score=114.14 TRINITY_DN30931_c0_g1_i1:4-1770(-)
MAADLGQKFAQGIGRRRRTRRPSLLTASTILVIALTLVLPSALCSIQPGGYFVWSSLSHWQPQRRHRHQLSARSKVRETEDKDGPDEIDEFEEAEDANDEDRARMLGLEDDVADSIVATTLNDASIRQEAEREAALVRTSQSQSSALSEGVVLPSGPVYDHLSLVEKYGGANKIFFNHKIAQQNGYFTQMDDLKTFLYEYIPNLNETKSKSFVEFEHASGSRLVLVGTNHICRASSQLTREIMQRERPECLVLESRIGDDSLQRLTVPEELIQNMSMSEPPGVFLSSDDEIDAARNFQNDRVWLEAFMGWRDIGCEAALCHEFGAAVEEFVFQRRKGSAAGPRGGTVCFGDSDLRPVYKRAKDELRIPPRVDELGEGPNIALRDLQMSQVMQAALRTHKSVVGVVGMGHLAGITRLLKQDKQIRVTKKGIPISQPVWVKDMEAGGTQWERDALGSCGMFLTLSQDLDFAPLGTFLTAEAALELQRMKEETAAAIKRQGLEEAEPVGPRSSDIGADFVSRNLMVTPKTEDDLRRWLAGERIPDQEAGVFPYENRRLRNKTNVLPGTGFPEKPKAEQNLLTTRYMKVLGE